MGAIGKAAEKPIDDLSKLLAEERAAKRSAKKIGLTIDAEKYLKEDKIRDSITGGGNSRVTYFDGKSQLPNFLLMDPSSEYPGAMKMNGIHEGSL